ncbi:MAG: DUF2892 domain-containing protein [Pseudomonadota bacterium]
MSVNVGSADRVVRLILGLVLIAFSVFSSMGPFGATIAAVIGTILAVTALVRFCPLYRLLGIRTCRV